MSKVLLPREIHKGLAGYDVMALRRALEHGHYRKSSEPNRLGLPMADPLVRELEAFQRHEKLGASGILKQPGFDRMRALHMMKAYEMYLIERERKVLQDAKLHAVPSLVISAALQGVRWNALIHYSQDGNLRWRGIHFHWMAPATQPDYADCSSYTTWLIWQALARVHGGHAGEDVVNGQGWMEGFTGTQWVHGWSVGWSAMVPGSTLVFYGWDINLGAPEHVAVYVGHGMVVSHGGEAGPLLLPVFYRPALGARRYPI